MGDQMTFSGLSRSYLDCAQSSLDGPMPRPSRRILPGVGHLQGSMHQRDRPHFLSLLSTALRFTGAPSGWLTHGQTAPQGWEAEDLLVPGAVAIALEFGVQMDTVLRWLHIWLKGLNCSRAHSRLRDLTGRIRYPPPGTVTISRRSAEQLLWPGGGGEGCRPREGSR